MPSRVHLGVREPHEGPEGGVEGGLEGGAGAGHDGAATASAGSMETRTVLENILVGW